MAYAPESTLSPKRLTAIVIVVLLHIGIIYALKAGLARKAIEVFTGPLDVKIIEEEIVQEKEPPPPPPKIETPPPFVPPPEININLPPPPPEAVFNVSPIKSPPGPPAPTVVAPPMVKTPPGTGGRALSEPEYPPVSRRLGHEGTVTLNLYILPDGRVGDGKILESSGYPKLDEAALNHALRAWRFSPARENGKPVAMWYPFKVTFQLTDAERAK